MSDRDVAGQGPSGLSLFLYKTKKSFRTPMPYLAFIGVGLWLATYWLLNEQLKISPFNKIPGPVEVLTEWFSQVPANSYCLLFGNRAGCPVRTFHGLV